MLRARSVLRGARRPASALLAALACLVAAPAAAAAAGPTLGLYFPSTYGNGGNAFQAVAPTLSGQGSEIAARGDGRINVGWRHSQPHCSDFDQPPDWSNIDPMMGAAIAAGVPVDATVVGAPRCARVKVPGSLHKQVEPKDRYKDDFARWVRKLVARYGPDGTYTNQVCETYTDCAPMNQVEVWNEPNLRVEWSVPDPQDYARFLVQVAAQIRKAPNGDLVDILTGGLAGHDRNKFLRGMYRVRGFKAAEDAIALHTYAPTPKAAVRIVSDAREIMAAHRDRGKIDITEHGWGTCPDPSADTSKRRKCVTPSAQARMLGAYVSLLRAQPELGVDDFLWYTPQDFATVQSAKDCPGDAKNFYGFFKHDGTAKPSWAKWQELTAVPTGTTSIAPNPLLRGCR